MITQETADTFLAEFAKDPDATAGMRLVADFVKSEPHLVAFMTLYFQAVKFECPLAGTLNALTFYERMRKAQEQADDLKGQMG